MPEVVLSGCRPEPIASYLRALGVLRLVAEQIDRRALGFWRDEEFVLETALSSEDLVRFFVQRYVPTPILAPWNKDSGFYRPGTAVGAIERSTDPRLAEYRAAIGVARQLLQEFDWTSQPGKEREKSEFVAAVRARLPDAALRWLDAVAALAGDDPAFAPLFGAGGVDGRFEFTRVYAQCLAVIFGLADGPRRRRTVRAPSTGLRAALFGELEAGSSVDATGGLLVPTSVDAPNAAPGFVGSKRVNPWEYVLALEGALLLAGAVARRFGSASGRLGVFPFTVEASSAGHASAGDESSQGEVWLPLWQRPMGLLELSHLFREGRAEWHRRQATTAADIARAIISLGVDRGLSQFLRFGVQGRSGKSLLAVPLGRWPVVERREAQLLAEVDDFLTSLRQAARGRNAPRALVEAFRRLEAAILGYAAYGGRHRLLDVLLAVARAEITLARRPGTRARGLPRPVSGLSPGWLASCDDGSMEFELAAAIASLRAAEQGRPGEFRRHLEPVDRRGRTWVWSESLPHAVVWRGRDTLRDLAAVLERRLIDAQQEGIEPPLDGRVRAHPEAVAALLKEEVDLDRLGRISEALALVDWRDGPVQLATRGARSVAALPASYAVLKLAFFGRPVPYGQQKVSVGPDATVLGLLRTGDVWGATIRAARRLRTVGLTPKGIPRDGRTWPLVPDRGFGRRLLAALLVPVHAGPLVKLALRQLDEGEMSKEGTT